MRTSILRRTQRKRAFHSVPSHGRWHLVPECGWRIEPSKWHRSVWHRHSPEHWSWARSPKREGGRVPLGGQLDRHRVPHWCWCQSSIKYLTQRRMRYLFHHNSERDWILVHSYSGRPPRRRSQEHGAPDSRSRHVQRKEERLDFPWATKLL